MDDTPQPLTPVDELMQQAATLRTDQRFEAAAEIYEHVITIAPQDHRAKLGLAQMRLEARNYFEAIRLSDELINEAQSLEILRDACIVKAYSYDRAGLDNRINLADDIVAAFTDALSSDPSCVEASVMLSDFIWDAKEDAESAVRVLHQALKYNPDSHALFTQLGFVQYFAHNYEQAADAYLRAEAVAPIETLHIERLAGALAAQGRYGEILDWIAHHEKRNVDETTAFLIERGTEPAAARRRSESQNRRRGLQGEIYDTYLQTLITRAEQRPHRLEEIMLLAVALEHTQNAAAHSAADAICDEIEEVAPGQFKSLAQTALRQVSVDLRSLGYEGDIPTYFMQVRLPRRRARKKRNPSDEPRQRD